MATPRIAAGALFFDREGRILLVRPTYKPHWDIPGGYVQPGESPRAACVREIHEELSLMINVGPLLVVDWAPADNEGDKILFVFDAGQFDAETQHRVALCDGELAEWRLVTTDDLPEYTPDRLTRRIQTAVNARREGSSTYTEHGVLP